MLGNRPNGKRVGLVKSVLGKLQDVDTSTAMARKLWLDLRWQIQATATSYDDICARVNDAVAKAEEIPDTEIRLEVIARMREMQKRAAQCSSAPEEFAPSELVVCSKCGRECGELHVHRSGGIILCKDCV